MKKILVDTDVLIEFFRLREKSQSIFSKIFNLNIYLPVISSITVAELFAGKSINDKKEELILNEFLDKIEILYPNLKIMKLTGEVLRENNYKITFQDAEIAAFSLYYHLPLLTKNKKDFKKIKGLKLFSY